MLVLNNPDPGVNFVGFENNNVGFDKLNAGFEAIIRVF